MKEIKLNKIEKMLRNYIQHYNENIYWKRRSYVVTYKQGFLSKLKALYFLWYIKKCDAFNLSSMGTHLGFGAVFKGIPYFPHGLNGIIISHNAEIGENCKIFHQVTIGEGHGGAPQIGDNVTICTGAKITGKIKIGNNVTIGTNCVIVEDIPDNALVVMNKPKIIIKQR